MPRRGALGFASVLVGSELHRELESLHPIAQIVLVAETWEVSSGSSWLGIVPRSEPAARMPSLGVEARGPSEAPTFARSPSCREDPAGSSACLWAGSPLVSVRTQAHEGRDESRGLVCVWILPTGFSCLLTAIRPVRLGTALSISPARYSCALGYARRRPMRG